MDLSVGRVKNKMQKSDHIDRSFLICKLGHFILLLSPKISSKRKYFSFVCSEVAFGVLMLQFLELIKQVFFSAMFYKRNKCCLYMQQLSFEIGIVYGDMLPLPTS